MSMRPNMPAMLLSRRAKIGLAVVGIIVVLLIVLVQFTGVYINYLWFGEVGHRNVYTTMFWTRLVLFFVFGLLMALIIAGNMAVAYLLRPPFRPMSPEQQNLQHYVLMIEPRRKLLLAGVFGLTLLAEGASAQGDWQSWQLWLNGGSFNMADPQFHKDISFYAFDYPVYRLLLSFGFTAVIVSILLSVGIHYLSGAIRLQTPGPKITLSARRHLTVLVFVFMALKAVAYWFDRYGFVFSQRSKFTGASYTDVHSALPAKTILFWIAIVLAIGVLASIWLKSALLPGIGFVVLLVLSILISGVYPAVVQQVSVKPNASDKEAPYISRNIAATRDAYDIQTRSTDKKTGTESGTVTYQGYTATSQPARSAVTDTNTTVDNIRILDPNVISRTFVNAQKIGRPYAFSNKLDVDRYTIDGIKHDYIVAVREQATGSNLTGSQNNWINQHTVYTHGYGFVAAEADQDVTKGNASDYTEGGIPPSGALKIRRPEVYYGQLMNDYSIVGAKGTKRENNGNDDPNITYGGKGGVGLSSFFTKLAFAVDYKETSFVLNDAVSAPGARIIFNRDPKQRLQKVAPFLTVDGDPYPFVDPDTGHIMWMLDGYTTTANYPYSERQSLSELTGTSLRQDQRDTQINYIRNSVKATVDAYDGTVKLYQWDDKDPMLKAWMKVFPGLVSPKSKMPAAVQQHIRYPQDLFNVQRALLAQYHITNPVASYNGNGKWAVPSDPFATGDQPPYYVLATPPTNVEGSTADAQFQLTSPMVVSNAPNLAAYLSVNSDPGPNYGQITALTVPGKSAIQGPGQIANIFKSQTQISKDIALLDTGQSEVLHGNLLTLPLGNSFLYVEPLYVQSTSTASSYPTLQRVLVTYGDKIGYGSTLNDALADIQQGRETGSSVDAGQTSGADSGDKTPSGSPTPTTSPTTSPTSPAAGSSTAPPAGGGQPTSVTQVLTQLDTAKANLDKAYDSHNQIKIAEAQQKINDLLDDYARLRPTPKPSR